MIKRALPYALVLVLAPAATSQAAGVPSPNPKNTGIVAPTVLSPALLQSAVAQGATPVENPTLVDLGGGSSATISYYGYWNDGPMVPAPGDVQSVSHNVESTKTEPDKNTYLVLQGQHGADSEYDYGTHFLFQGHESGPARSGGAGEASFISRVNLDADAAHRVTVLATADLNGVPLPDFDGSTWDPFAQKLLFTGELGNVGGVWQATLDYPSVVEDISGSLGRGGYEGIQTDVNGSLWIVEDVGGAKGSVNNKARQPNSFIYRFVPKTAGDLKQGRLQALQVISVQNGQPIVFHSGQADADILALDQFLLHTYTIAFHTNWITLHDTDVDGSTPFDANALAKTKLATPFKRPENGLFRPGTSFTQYVFATTGDTDALTQAGSTYGGFGGVFRLTQASAAADHGTLKLVYRCDVAHTAFDNLAFYSKDRVVIVEDRGDTLHSQANAFDSAYLVDLTTDYSNSANQPVRIIAQGRDASATIDAALLLGGAGFQNDGDNEITGTHISDGDPTEFGLLGAKIPQPYTGAWRFFYTHQHGDNVTYEITKAKVYDTIF